MKAHRYFVCRISTRVGLGSCSGAKAYDIPLVYFDSDVVGADVAQHHQGLRVLVADALAGSDVDLQNDSVHRRDDGRPVDLDLDLFDLGPRLAYGGVGDLNVRLPGSRLEQLVFRLRRACSCAAASYAHCRNSYSSWAMAPVPMRGLARFN